MFEIEDSEDVKLKGNRTSGGTLLRGRRVGNVEAEGNVAGDPAEPQTKQWYEKPLGLIATGIVVTVIGGLILAKFTG